MSRVFLLLLTTVSFVLIATAIVARLGPSTAVSLPSSPKFVDTSSQSVRSGLAPREAATSAPVLPTTQQQNNNRIRKNGILFDFEPLQEREADKMTALKYLRDKLSDATGDIDRASGQMSLPPSPTLYLDELRRCVPDPDNIKLVSRRHVGQFIASSVAFSSSKRDRVTNASSSQVSPQPILNNNSVNKKNTRLRVACLISGLMRSYQEVLLAGNMRFQRTVFGPHGCTDLFISTSNIRGWSQLRFRDNSDNRNQNNKRGNTSSHSKEAPPADMRVESAGLLYENSEHDVALEINATFAEALRPEKGAASNAVAPTLRYIRVVKRDVDYISSFAQRSPSLLSLPLYEHMLANLYAALDEERTQQIQFDAFVQLRPDLVFAADTPPFQLVATEAVAYEPRNRDDRLFSHLFLRYGSNVLIKLSSSNLVVPSRRTDATRTNDYLTIGSAAAMRKFIQNGYYLIKYGSDAEEEWRSVLKRETNKHKQSSNHSQTTSTSRRTIMHGIVSERAKRVLGHSILSLNFCSLWIPAEVRKKGRRTPNSVFCFVNCSATLTAACANRERPREAIHRSDRCLFR